MFLCSRRMFVMLAVSAWAAESEGTNTLSSNHIRYSSTLSLLMAQKISLSCPHLHL